MPVKNEGIVQLESELRAKVQRIAILFSIIIFIIEVALCIYFHSTHMRQTLSEYIANRIAIPTLINIFLCFTIYLINSSTKLSSVVQNRVCSTGLILLCCEVSIFHSYFIQLWPLSLFALTFAGVFHDAKFQKIQAVICYINIVIAGISHIIDYPDQLAYSIECIIVSEVVAAAVTYLASVLEKASFQRYLFSVKANAGIEKYKSGYEYDALTGVYSRGHLWELANKVFDWSSPDESIGIAMIDIDDFKKVNDTYGHDNGDIVLNKLGQMLSYFNDNMNVCGRFGGEEFLLIFHNSESKRDVEELNQIKDYFHDLKFDFMDKPITISIGYHACEFGSSLEESLKKADEALYESKRTGKNKITVKD